MTRREYWMATFWESRWGAYWVRLEVWFCGLRGHPWSEWMYDFDGSSCRTCSRCDGYELRDR